MFFLERATLMQWIPRSTPPDTELIDAMIELANNSFLMVIWFGPVLWIGIALFEELSRTFLLKCLWNTSKKQELAYPCYFLNFNTYWSYSPVSGFGRKYFNWPKKHYHVSLFL